MATICGVNCNECWKKQDCKGCAETNGHPFGGNCVAAECIKKCGKEAYLRYKKQMIGEFNALGIKGMPEVTELVELTGSFVNLEYQLPNGQKIRLLDDNCIYMGYQLKKTGSDRCFGLVADDNHLLVCEYGCNATDPEIVLYKRR
ncbi:MAG TPA: DUF3795 domain-containing protein [Lachnospiraceae bacterium]|nr:DUF3795 domain-containing protein [Lachnospiraceae bacterium]